MITISKMTSKNGDLVLLYDSNFMKFLGKCQFHSLGSYIIKEIMDGGAVHLVKMNGGMFPGKVNGIQLKFYKGDPTSM